MTAPLSYTAWAHLLRVAQAGTRHSPAPLPAGPAPVAVPGSREHQALVLAGRLARQQKTSGQAVQGGGTGPAACPPETQPALGPLGEHVLELMLQGHYSVYLHSYYAAMAARGLRVPHRLLAAVLEEATKDPHHLPYEDLPDVLGQRGQWLARLHPAWRPLVAIRDEETWTHGTWDQRRRFLRALRRVDPAQARARLAAFLTQTDPGEQDYFLSDLYGQVAPADEPLLVPCLSSPNRAVRQTAARLLALLPGSALGEQLWTWAQPLLTLTRHRTQGLALTVTLPARWPPEWEQAGLEPECFHFSSQPAGWVGQLLELIPPHRWSEHWQLEPLRVLELAAATPLSPDLGWSWARATYWHRQAAWGAAFMQAKLTLPQAARWSTLAWDCVLPDQVEALVLLHIPADARLSDTPAPWQEVLLSSRPPWSALVLKRVLRLMEDTLMETAPAPAWDASDTIRRLLVELVEVVNEAQYEELERRLQALLDVQHDHADRLRSSVKVLQFLRLRQRALAEPPAPSG